MATLKADRRLYVTADRSEVVEEGDPRGAFLLAAAGREIQEGDVARYNLSMRRGKVVIGEVKRSPPPENKMVEKPENKAGVEKADTLGSDGSESEEEEDDEASEEEKSGEGEEEWTLKTPPEDYLERHGDDAPNSDLAKRILARREE